MPMRSLTRNRLLVACLSFIVLLKLLVPAGYMPEISAGSFNIIVCHTGMPEGFDATGKGDHANHHQHGKSGSDVCSYGAAPHSALTLTAFLLALLLVCAPLRFVRRDSQLTTLSIRAAYPRGPPTL